MNTDYEQIIRQAEEKVRSAEAGKDCRDRALARMRCIAETYRHRFLSAVQQLELERSDRGSE